jgi:cell division protein FtsZ
VPEVLKRALKSPLVNQGLLLQKAQNLIVHIAGGESITLSEVDQLMKQLGKYVPEETQIMFGVTVEPKLGDLLTVTLMSSLSAKDMALETSHRSGSSDRIPTRLVEPVRSPEPPRAAEPAQPVSKSVEPEPERQPVHLSVGSNGKHSVTQPVVSTDTEQPEFFPAMEAKASAAPKVERAPAEDRASPTTAEAAAPLETPASPPLPSSAEMWFAPVEPPPPPVAPPPPVREPEPAAPRADASPAEESPASQPAPVSTPPKTATRPSPAKHTTGPVKAAPVNVQPVAVVKTSIFSVIEDDEEEEDTGTNWAEKYIKPTAAPGAPPQVERREPALAAVGAATVKAPGAQKQPSLNLHQENVGRFKGTDKTIVEGEDLDVPTWMRMRGKVGK